MLVKERLQVIYVDDDESLIDFFSGPLKKCDIDLRTFNHARDAFEEIKINPSKYDVVISDYSMPDIDGLTFLKMLKENDYFEIKKVAIFSSLIEDESFLMKFNRDFLDNKEKVTLIHGKPVVKELINFINKVKIELLCVIIK